MMRIEHQIISQWVKPGSRVLDLGCGSGSLLQLLSERNNCVGYGLEIDSAKITAGIERGVNIIEQNLDNGLANFESGAFDVIVMSQTLQAIKFPHRVIDEVLRIGRECIVTFPNFGHWRCRASLILNGRMPMSKALPYMWYDTPNIHLCTIDDFEALCREKSITILNREVLNDQQQNSAATRLLPNLCGAMAIYRLARAP